MKSKKKKERKKDTNRKWILYHSFATPFGSFFPSYYSLFLSLTLTYPHSCTIFLKSQPLARSLSLTRVLSLFVSSRFLTQPLILASNRLCLFYHAPFHLCFTLFLTCFSSSLISSHSAQLTLFFYSIPFSHNISRRKFTSLFHFFTRLLVHFNLETDRTRHEPPLPSIRSNRTFLPRTPFFSFLGFNFQQVFHRKLFYSIVLILDIRQGHDTLATWASIVCLGLRTRVI